MLQSAPVKTPIERRPRSNRDVPSRTQRPAEGSRRRPPGAPLRREGSYRVAEEVGRKIAYGHPWVYREAFGGRPPTEPDGTVVDILTGNGEFVGRGFTDSEHAIAVRILSRDPKEAVHPGAGAITRRFESAVQARWILRAAERDKPVGMRLFNGDSEGLPGVTVDRYADYVVVQWLSQGALAWQEELYESIVKMVKPTAIYEQRRVRPLAGQAPPEAAHCVWGKEAPLEVVVEEAGTRLSVDVTAPLGVGIFPDLRLGRDLVASLASGRRVLNLFSYTGAFSVRSVAAGAESVVAVDTSARVHARARRNFELSGLDPEKMECITDDAGKTLERFVERGRQFDLVVCDPPTFSHGQAAGQRFSVAKDLVGVLASSMRVLTPGGLLAAATNSVKISMTDFERILGEASYHAGVDARIVSRVGLPPDFPVAPGFPEGNYLKFLLVHRR